VRSIKIVYLLLTVLVTLVGPVTGWAQGYQKHPRAMELERQMTKDALDFLKSRFPDYPVIVTVAVDPIYRLERKEKGQSENLPFFRADEEEILDEWDDPSLPNSVLLSRVKKVVVNVSVPAHLTDDEVAEIKQSLGLNLNLLAARDNVEILRRSWGQKKEPEFNPWNYVWVVVAGFTLFFLALLAAIWTPIRQIVRVLREGVTTAKGSNNAAAPSMIMPVAPKGRDGSSMGMENASRSQGPKGDVRFSDPINLQTAISLFLNNLVKVESFPNLSDMILLDEMCIENPSLVGAFLMECSNALREKIFSYTYGNHWLEAMHKPGAVDIRVFEMVHKLNRMPRTAQQDKWDFLLLLVWRLADRRGEFLRDLPQADAFAILHHLPKALALKTAREMWPGSWAVLLDPNYQSKKLSNETIVTVTMSALEMVPMRSMESLHQFRQDKELMDFLGTVDPVAEREIYVASPKTSILHQIRPPFFKVFDAPDDVLKNLVESISLSDWALALSNVPQSDRKKVETLFTGKQKQRYLELLNQFESSDVDLRMVGDTRVRIAELLNRLSEASLLAQFNDENRSGKDGRSNDEAA
jgi:hypothetical protein